LLFIYNFKISIIVIILSVSLVFLIKKIFSSIIFDLASKEQYLNGQKNKIILESLNGIKLIKSFQLENKFINKFYEILIKGVSLKYKITSIKNIPRLWIEFVILNIIFLIGIILNLSGYSFEDIIIFLSIFAITMLRFLPCLLSIIKNINMYNQASPSIALLEKEFDIDSKLDLNSAEVKYSSKIELRNLSFKYENRDEFILNNTSLLIKKGYKVIGLKGASGSGKTTIIDILTGLYPPTSGDYLIDDKNIIDHKNKKFLYNVQNLFSYVPQNTYLFDDTIKNNIYLAVKSNNLNNENFYEVLKEVQLYDFVMNCPQKENTQIGENGVKLSGGQVQRIGLARGLILDPQIIVLDESTNSLDQKTEDNIFMSLSKISKKRQIIVISHSEIINKYCDQIFEIKNGKIIKEK